MKYIIGLLLSITSSIIGFSQECNLQLSGHVEDADTKEKLSGAMVEIKELKRQLLTDEKGDFNFALLCPGHYTILISHIGCDAVEKQISLTRNQHIDIFMPHARTELGEVVVISGKGVENTGIKKQLTAKKLEESKGQSLSEALSHINGVNMLQTGTSAAKPVIHGMHGSRIIMINNGVRQEGQQWGNEHAPEIDAYIADKLTVIKGVDELRYGADAVGGVIIVEPKPLRARVGSEAVIHAGYFTNNRQYAASAIWEERFRKDSSLSYRLQTTYKQAANAATPDYRLNNTAANEINFSATVGLHKKNYRAELYYSQFRNKIGIFSGSHIGNITDLKNAIAAARPADVFIGENTYQINRPRQEVVHHLLKLKTSFNQKANRINLLIAAQFNNRKEYDVIRSDEENDDPQMHLHVSTFTQDLNWESSSSQSVKTIAGITLMQQQNYYGGRYFIPNYFSFGISGYAIAKWRHHDWEWQAGINYNNKSINTERLKHNGERTDHDFSFSTVASSFNAVYTLGKAWKFNANIGLASRAPQVNELLSDGIHEGTATYEKGNIFLNPEKAFNFSGGVQYASVSKKVNLEMLVYANLINDFIYQQPRPDNPVLTIAGAFPRIEYNQTNALLSGIDISGTVAIARQIDWSSSISYLRARNRTAKDWLILMPANRLRNEITFRLKNKPLFSDSYVAMEMLNVMEQKNVPTKTGQLQDYKTAPPAYTLLNLNASTTVYFMKQPITVGLGVRNLLNKVYREYLNSMRYFSDEMGRNINIRIKIIL